MRLSKVVVLSLGLAQATARTTSRDCKHGTWDITKQACQCDVGWGTAGITDTLDFLEGVCEQYHCQSDQLCQEVLEIDNAQCVVKNWNCYCGFAYALMNGMHGYEVNKEQRGGAECMGIMYAFSIWATQWVEWVMSLAWKFFVVLALFALPWGRKRTFCDHHQRSMWNWLRQRVGWTVVCRGDCSMSPVYNWDCFQDDLAWTIYVLDIGIWAYLFLATLYCVVLFIWSIVLWVLVFVALVLFLIAALCAACGEGVSCDGGCGGGCDGNIDCCPGDCCCPVGVDGGAAAGSADFYYGGVFPADPLWGYTGTSYTVDTSGTGCCDCCCPRDSGCCCGACKPLAWLCLVFPRLPENAWGGLVGYIWFGTHRHTPPERLYRDRNSFIEFFNFRRTAEDLHDAPAGEDWRQRVHEFLRQDWRQEARDFLDGGPTVEVTGNDWMSPVARLLRSEESVPLNTAGQRVLRVHSAQAVILDRPFNKDEDRCVDSSFADYESNTCWICMQAPETPEKGWDLWVSCRHLFCEKCSTEMLRRRMPCPLCRVASTHVLRGKQYGQSASQTESGSGLSNVPEGANNN